MILEYLELVNFKNYSKLQQAFEERIICFTGANGSGKTNLLDAIAYLCIGKSYLQASDRNVVRKGETFFRVAGRFQKADVAHKIEIKYKTQKPKEIILNNNKLKKVSELVGQFPVVLVFPDDVIAFLGASEERRRFMDFTICQYNATYFQALVEYNKILKHRNAALKEEVVNLQLIDVLGQQMLPHADYIYEQRKAFAEAFIPYFEKAYQRLAEDREVVKINFKSKLHEDTMEALLEERREKDLILQRTSQGIHKDDLGIQMDEDPLKTFASQGQRKTLLLALKIAQFDLLRSKTNQNPILLLDDFFEKLDETRLQALLKLVVEMEFEQIFLTDTHPERVYGLIKQLGENFKIFEINDLHLESWNKDHV